LEREKHAKAKAIRRGRAREANSKHRFPTEANASRILSNLALSDISEMARSCRELKVD
jgi:hypothetical protein